MSPERDLSRLTEVPDIVVRRIMNATQDTLHEAVKAAANSVYAAGFNQGLDEAIETVGQWQSDRQTSTELPQLIRFQALEEYSEETDVGDVGNDYLSHGVRQEAQHILSALSSSEADLDKSDVASDWLHRVQEIGLNDGLEDAVEVVDAWHQSQMTSTDIPQRMRQQKTKVRPLSVAESTEWRQYPLAPWRRFFARTFDTLINGTVTFFPALILLSIVAPVQAEQAQMLLISLASIPGWLSEGVSVVVIVLFSLPLTGVLIGLTGSSLGKWLFGVRVLGNDGRPIGVATALRREVIVWIVGLGLGIYILSFITQLLAYRRLTREKTTYWDGSVGAVVLHRPKGREQDWLMVLGFAIYLGVVAAFRLLTQ